MTYRFSSCQIHRCWISRSFFSSMSIPLQFLHCNRLNLGIIKVFLLLLLLLQFLHTFHEIHETQVNVFASFLFLSIITRRLFNVFCVCPSRLSHNESKCNSVRREKKKIKRTRTNVKTYKRKTKWKKGKLFIKLVNALFDMNFFLSLSLFLVETPEQKMEQRKQKPVHRKIEMYNMSWERVKVCTLSKTKTKYNDQRSSVWQARVEKV